ncbi:hypothetical protein [uncultured Paraglaciecola sp.]|uniref:hypothetical protein n=1 Tax=uncultured Paraglaciecola sp. TaxID=1765024 RepID=UPI002633397D|nr:hypothetical protein [uncultured Paraglaciecola sp.]
MNRIIITACLLFSPVVSADYIESGNTLTFDDQWWQVETLWTEQTPNTSILCSGNAGDSCDLSTGSYKWFGSSGGGTVTISGGPVTPPSVSQPAPAPSVATIITASDSCLDDGTSVVVCVAECPTGKQAIGPAFCKSHSIGTGEFIDVDQNGNYFYSLDTTGLQMTWAVGDTAMSCQYEFPYATSGLDVRYQISLGVRCM